MEAFKILYLLGDGASMEALPLIKKTEYNDGLSMELQNFVLHNIGAIERTTIGITDQLIENLKYITRKCVEFGTPDFVQSILRKLVIFSRIRWLKYFSHCISGMLNKALNPIEER